MVKRFFFAVWFCSVAPIFGGLTIQSSTVDLSGPLAQELITKLGTTLDQVFFGVASIAGPGIVNSAAFASTIGIQSQQAERPFFQLEPSVGLVLPSGEGQGDEQLQAMPMYAANLVGGFRLDEKTGIQVRGFYLPQMPLPVKGASISFQPINFGATLTREIKKPGKEWYSFAIVAPFDLAYMHGSLTADFTNATQSFRFDAAGDNSATATASVSFRDRFDLRWNVYSATTGLIFVKPFWGIFVGRLGWLSSLNLGSSTFTNTATGLLSVSASTGSGASQFKIGDTAQIILTNEATFRPVLVSNQIALGLGIRLGPATLNLDYSQNLQINAKAIIVQMGCWF